ncbi:endolytic transglycosylase MltG [Bacillus solimangrovi]|uniref:Aminodeoxychorismate lyase n=1 Tax=Bacillus solimangrovi TaxID=1305675 RepID=A0A1E5LFR0_9BACI|nr:endolytic transglycosylase MltG [Bacillus solimangrovi]OEH92912.1 hypothetical protein BFG57_14660 [Bacillus solimangrovi]
MSRNTIRAFAFGMITAATILTIVYFVDSKQLSPTAELTITEENVNEYLTANNKVQLTKEEYDILLKTKEQLATHEQQNTNNELITDNEIKGSETKEEQEDVYSFTYIIHEGTSSTEVSKILEENKIIDNADDFNKFLMRNGLAGSIQVGTYEITKGMSYETISELLTK